MSELKHTFRPILELFSETFGKFSFQAGGSRRLSNPLSIYDPAPYFSEGSGPIFPHGPMFPHGAGGRGEALQSAAVYIFMYTHAGVSGDSVKVPSQTLYRNL